VNDYTLVPGPPRLDDYLTLRSIAGLSPKSSDQGAGALSGSWSFCHVLFAETTVVAMGRAIGDGGWYFHVCDMATHPDHQRKGLGRKVLDWLIADIEERAPDGAFVSLIADPPGVALYKAVGMRETAPSVGMALIVGDPGGRF
jgi:ribosomal protein S18 acetylase RimI-like enzyme